MHFSYNFFHQNSMKCYDSTTANMNFQENGYDLKMNSVQVIDFNQL